MIQTTCTKGWYKHFDLETAKSKYYEKVEEGQIPVENYAINAKPVAFHLMVQSIRDGQFAQVEVNEYFYSDLLLSLMEKYSADIDDLYLPKKIIDIFFRKTQTFYLAQLLVYACFFLLPFFCQMYQTDTSTGNQCLILCFITQTFFFMLELIQMRDQGLAYMNEYYNQNDCLQYLVFLTILVLRWNDPEPLLPDSDHARSHTRQALLSCLSILLVASILSKIKFFLRLSDYMGQLVQLIDKCSYETWTISNFLTFFCMFFSLIFIYLGDSGDDKDYEGINVFLAMNLNVLRNAIGDIIVPTYTYWIEKHDEAPRTSHAAIMVLWLIWDIQIFIMLIMLLNFLIAIVSQTYEDVMDKHDQISYLFRAELNRECRVILNFFGLDSKVGEFMVTTSTLSDQKNVWQGYLQTLKKFSVAENEKMVAEIKEQLSDQSVLQQAREQIQTKIKQTQLEISDDIAELNQLLNKVL